MKMTIYYGNPSSEFHIVDESGNKGGTYGLLLYNGGTVCDDGFDQNAADAICSLLGYAASNSEWDSEYKWSNQYIYKITMDDVKCPTSSWSSCRYSDSNDCGHNEDVFLGCSDGSPGEKISIHKIRLK